MLASTIQFSKYGQENQPQPDTYQEEPQPQGNNTPRARTPSTVYRRPAPATNHTLTSVTVTQKKQSQTPRNKSCEPGPIPQDPTARLGDPLGHSTFHAHK
jgi:hypothetical protein